MKKDLAQKAISLALQGNWLKAQKINKEILKNNMVDVDALNRLARTYVELGEIKKARKTAKKVLSIDPLNTIAKKCLAKWKNINKNNHKSQKLTTFAFLEEAGKTKIVPLIYLGNPNIIAKVDAGEEVKLGTSGHRVSVCTFDNEYIGRLSDDLSAKLKKMISEGNEYKVYIKSAEPKTVKIFIKETRKAKKLLNAPSFSNEKIDYFSYTHKKGNN